MSDAHAGHSPLAAPKDVASGARLQRGQPGRIGSIEPGIHQKLRLRGEARHVGARRKTSLRDGREIHPGGQVLQTRVPQGIFMLPMPEKGAEGTARARRGIQLASRQAVVDVDGHPGHQLRQRLLDPGARREAGLEFGAGRQRLRQLIGDGGKPLLQHRDCGLPVQRQPRVASHHELLLQAGRVATQTFHGQGIQHFVGQQYAAPRCHRVPGPPANTGRQVWRHGGHRRRLPFAQLCRDLDDGVGIRQLSQFRQALQHLHRQSTTAGAVLDQCDRQLAHRNSPTGGGGAACGSRAVSGAKLTENLGHLSRHTSAEQGGHLGRSDEVAGGAELARAGGVVTQPRRVQGLRHERGKRHLASRRGNAGSEVGCHARGMGGFVRREFWQGQAGFHHAIITRRAHRIGILPAW